MAFHAVPDVPEMLTAGREREYMSLFLRTMGAFDTTAVTDDDLDEYVRCYTAPGAWHAAFQYYRAWFDDVRLNQAARDAPARDAGARDRRRVLVRDRSRSCRCVRWPTT